MYQMIIVIGDLGVEIADYEVNFVRAGDTRYLKKVRLKDGSVIYAETLYQLHSKLSVVASIYPFDAPNKTKDRIVTTYAIGPKGRLEQLSQEEEK